MEEAKFREWQNNPEAKEAGALRLRLSESRPYGCPRLSYPRGLAALLTPRQRSGGLPNRLCRFLSLNGTYDLTGK
jgi:hypothetical protein